MEMYTKSSNVIETEVGNSLVILNTSTLKYFEVSGAGTRIWETLKNGMATEEQLVANLLAQFEVDEATCRSEVRAFLEQAKSLDLISNT
jgi:hypothetical protein